MEPLLWVCCCGSWFLFNISRHGREASRSWKRETWAVTRVSLLSLPQSFRLFLLGSWQLIPAHDMHCLMLSWWPLLPLHAPSWGHHTSQGQRWIGNNFMDLLLLCELTTESLAFLLCLWTCLFLTQTSLISCVTSSACRQIYMVDLCWYFLSPVSIISSVSTSQGCGLTSCCANFLWILHWGLCVLVCVHFLSL